MNRRLTVVLGLAVAAVLALSACSREAATQQMPPPPEVSAAPVLIKEVSRWDDTTGRIEAVESVELRPRVSGYIERVNDFEGMDVARGDVLFVIDQRGYRAAFARAEADLDRARAQASLAAVEIERARKLADGRLISNEELDQRQAAFAQAEAGVRAAQAALDAAALDLEYTEVRAPISGRAGRALVTGGNLVSTGHDGTLLTTIVSLDPIHVHFASDERTFLNHRATARKAGRHDGRDARYPVRVGLIGEAGHPHEGLLDFIDNRIDPATGTIRARARISNGEGILMPGLFARVQVLTGEPFEAMLIDDRAVLTDQDRKYVYVVDQEGRAMRRDVRLGPLVDRLRMVDSGLAAGDRVIVHGVQKIFFPGMPVQAHDIAMGDPPPAPENPAQPH